MKNIGGIQMIRCKFKCINVNVPEKDTPEATASLELVPVYANSKENKRFFKYTPGGEIKLQVVNPEAAKQFEIGKEYYVDFTAAE